MSIRTVVVGVDASPEGACAARTGAWIAGRSGAECRLVHAVAETWMTLPPPAIGVTATEELQHESIEQARALILQSLQDEVRPELRSRLAAIPGQSAEVIKFVAQHHHADLVVLGGKRRTGWGRLLGSTVTDFLRSSDLPLLVTERPMNSITRVLVATDLSPAAAPTIQAAERWARDFGASLRLLYVDESMPSPGVGMPRDEAAYRHAADRVKNELVPHITLSGTTVVIRPGRTATVIATEATQWKADLVILGSHGKGFVDRLILGSTSERLLKLLVVPTLVIHTGTPAVKPETWIGRMAVAAAPE